MMHAGVTLRAPGGRVLADRHGSDGLRVVRGGRVIKARTMAGLTLHILITSVGRGVVSRAVRHRVSKLVHTVAFLAGALHMPALSQRVPGMSVGRALPTCLLSDVTIAAHGELRAGVIVTEKVPGSRRRIIKENALHIDGLLIGTTGDDCRHGENRCHEQRRESMAHDATPFPTSSLPEWPRWHIPRRRFNPKPNG